MNNDEKIKSDFQGCSTSILQFQDDFKDFKL